MKETSLYPCASSAWNENEQQLFRWLLKQTQDEQLSQDILHEVFLRVMQQKEHFCKVENSKSWLFRVARNILIDSVRKERFAPLEQDIADDEVVYEAIDLLALSCLSRVLDELEPAEKSMIIACDLKGMNQKTYAQQNGLSLSALKSRLRRTRAKLKAHIQTSCQVKLDENQQVCCFTSREPV